MTSELGTTEERLGAPGTNVRKHEGAAGEGADGDHCDGGHAARVQARHRAREGLVPAERVPEA